MSLTMLKSLLIPVVSLLLMTTSCGENMAETCIRDRIATFKEDNANRSFTGIYTFIQDGENYTILDHGIAFDATAEVLNSECEVVCTYGGFRIPNSDCDRIQEGINRAVTEWEGGK